LEFRSGGNRPSELAETLLMLEDCQVFDLQARSFVQLSTMGNQLEVFLDGPLNVVPKVRVAQPVHPCLIRADTLISRSQ